MPRPSSAEWAQGAPRRPCFPPTRRDSGWWRVRVGSFTLRNRLVFSICPPWCFCSFGFSTSPRIVPRARGSEVRAAARAPAQGTSAQGPVCDRSSASTAGFVVGGLLPHPLAWPGCPSSPWSSARVRDRVRRDSHGQVGPAPGAHSCAETRRARARATVCGACRGHQEAPRNTRPPSLPPSLPGIPACCFWKGRPAAADSSWGALPCPPLRPAQLTGGDSSHPTWTGTHRVGLHWPPWTGGRTPCLGTHPT